ncbi:MAG TPA: hypothetical protein VGA60_07765 [Kiloniellales bacterium]|jgi:hypothetical protein
MANLFQTLLRPDQEEDTDRSEVAKAANLLQIGEFQLLQLAYFEWHGHELRGNKCDEIFRLYMVQSRVPAWARSYAKRISHIAELGGLDDHDPAYHRYDSEYYKALPRGVRRLAIAVCCIAFAVFGAIFFSTLVPQAGTSLLPPFFNEKELTPAKPSALRGS